MIIGFDEVYVVIKDNDKLMFESLYDYKTATDIVENLKKQDRIKVKIITLEQFYYKNNLKKHSNRVELLAKYTEFLQKECYIDTDATCEEPYAVDEFMKNLKQWK